jgi:hypothetical protein
LILGDFAANAGSIADNNNMVMPANVAARKDNSFFMVRAIPPESSRRARLSSERYGNVNGRRQRCWGIGSR